MIERTFTYYQIPKEDKVNCAAYILQGSVGHHWWDTIQYIEVTTQMTRAEFCKTFQNKHFLI